MSRIPPTLRHLARASTLTLILTFCFFISILKVNGETYSYLDSEYRPRKACKTSSDCGDPHKECVGGLCHCLPFYDDVHNVTNGHEEICMKSYLSNCNETELCNVHKHLVCDPSGTCVCRNDSTMVYDAYLETCAVTPGGIMCDLREFAQPVTDCVRNAECWPDRERKVDWDFFGKCWCSDGFVPSGRRCVPQLGAGCEVDSDCDQEGMECVGSNCSCMEGRLYDSVKNECRLKAGMSCDLEEEVDEDDICVEGASCVPVGYPRGVCACGKHYLEENGACKDMRVRAECGRKDSMQVFDEGRGRCSLRIGAKCRTEGLNLCVSSAFCGTGNKCQCYENYRITEAQLCELRNETEGLQSSTLSESEVDAPKEASSLKAGDGSDSSSARGLGTNLVLCLVMVVTIRIL